MGSERTLVLALCHELGNLLAASQLEAHLLRADETRRATSARRVAEISARAGALLAHLRPLLSQPATGASCDVLDVLDGLRRGLDEENDARVRIELKTAASLPAAAIDPEVLHPVLVTAIYGSLEAMGPQGRVEVAAERDGAHLRFRVDDPAPPEDAEGDDLRGRPLALAAARALLSAFGGDVGVEATPAGTRVSFRVPVSE